MSDYFFHYKKKNMDIKIRKAKLGKSGTLEATYIDADGNEITIKGKNIVHNDLRTALAQLVPYFADLTEQKEADNIEWDELESAENVELLRRLDVSGVSLGSDETMPMVTMTGSRTLMTSKVLNLNAPAVDINGEESDWEHLPEFDMAVQRFIYECEQYIKERKWSVKQQEIDFEDNEDPFAEAEPVEEANMEPASVA